MSKLVRESINFERGGDPKKTLRVGRLERLKEKYSEEDLQEVLKSAAEKGNIEDVKFLVEKGVDTYSDDDPPLWYAAALGHLDVVKYLVQQGVEMNEMSNMPLIGAATGGYLDIVKYLIEHGSDLEDQGKEALDWATSRGHLDVVKYLVERGVNIDRETLYIANQSEHHDIENYLKSKLEDG